MPEKFMDIAAFRQMVAKKPDRVLGCYGLRAKLFQAGKKLAEAAERVSMALKLGPVHVISHVAPGWA